jgi:hypothetical protein
MKIKYMKLVQMVLIFHHDHEHDYDGNKIQYTVQRMTTGLECW